MAAGLVLELQADALKPATRVVDLLRKATVVATKLHLTDALDWIRREINGFEDATETPAYRCVLAALMVHTRFHGEQPVLYEDRDMRQRLSRICVRQGIAEIEVLASQNQQLRMEADHIGAAFGFDQPTYFRLGPSAMSGILDAVRQKVLEWALALEQQGILGEGLSFSLEEKQIAESLDVTTNFYGPVGMANVQHQPVHSPQSATTGVAADELRALVLEVSKAIAAEDGDVKAEMQPVLDMATQESRKDCPDPNKVGSAVALVRETAVKEGTKRAIDALLGAIPALTALWSSR